MLTTLGYGTASWLEILWTLAAIPGFVLWFHNAHYARKSLRAAKQLKNTNGRLLWAKFSFRLTGLMTFIEFTFIIVGCIALLLAPNPTSTLVSTIIISGGLIICSIFITLLAYQWRAVEYQILEIARLRRAEQSEMDLREVAQNTRDTDQNLRTFKQDLREKDQNG